MSSTSREKEELTMKQEQNSTTYDGSTSRRQKEPIVLTAEEEAILSALYCQPHRKLKDRCQLCKEMQNHKPKQTQDEK